MGSRLVVWSPESVTANWDMTLGADAPHSRPQGAVACADGRGETSARQPGGTWYRAPFLGTGSETAH